jgi:DNA processing protein
MEYIMNWDVTADENKNSNLAKHPEPDPSLSEEEKKVLQLLRLNKEMLLDELSWQSQIPLNQLASVLLNLELSGYVKALPGKKFAAV